MFLNSIQHQQNGTSQLCDKELGIVFALQRNQEWGKFPSIGLNIVLLPKPDPSYSAVDGLSSILFILFLEKVSYSNINDGLEIKQLDFIQVQYELDLMLPRIPETKLFHKKVWELDSQHLASRMVFLKIFQFLKTKMEKSEHVIPHLQGNGGEWLYTTTSPRWYATNILNSYI